MYEQYVRNTVNPQLPPGLTFALPGDTSSGWVKFDDCRESDGTMIEAKGNYAGFLATPIGERRLTEDWLYQADMQVKASQGRRIEWYFHDASAAAFANKIFAEAHYDRTISVHFLPYPGRRSETQPADQMMLRESYWMKAQWGARVETPAALADRFLRTMDAIRPLHPLLDTWTWGDSREVWETKGQAAPIRSPIFEPIWFVLSAEA